MRPRNWRQSVAEGGPWQEQMAHGESCVNRTWF